jgi:hypothetical protein
MSIKVMSYIWEHSPHKGSELITLLAIADYADDQGVAYPSIASLSKKTRMTERNVDHVLKKLVRHHALTIARQAGPYRNNVYSIQLPTRKDGHGEKFSGGDGEKFSPSDDEKFSPSIPHEASVETTTIVSQQPGMVKSFQGGMVKTSAEKMTPVFTQTIIRDPSEEKNKDLPPSPLTGELAVTEGSQGGDEKGKRRSRKPTQLDMNYTPGFSKWWAVYPADRRTDKPQCFAKWQEYNLEARTEELVAKIERLKNTTWNRPRTERGFIKSSLPYLNGGRFEDELVPLECDESARPVVVPHNRPYMG